MTRQVETLSAADVRDALARLIDDVLPRARAAGGPAARVAVVVLGRALEKIGILGADAAAAALVEAWADRVAETLVAMESS